MGGPGGRKKAKVWKHVDILDEKTVRCRHCDFEFAGGANRIGSHLGLNKSKGIRRCDKFGQPVGEKSMPSSHNFEGGEHNELNETSKLATAHLLEVDTNKKPLSCHFGPFSLPLKYELLDLELIQYVFNPSQDPSEEVVRYPHYLLKRSDFNTLRPQTSLNSTVIDIFAEHFTKIEEERMKNEPTRNWYLPLLFSRSALAGNASSFLEFVQRQNMKNDFMPSNLTNCNKMFIPAHIGSDSDGHYYLYVLHLKERVVEIWDSLPSYSCTIKEERNEKTQNLLFALDKLFENDKSKIWAFSKFSVKMAENTPKQSNGYDCGIFVIKFMKDAVDARNNKPFESDKERLNLALELLKSDLNKGRETLIDKAITWHHESDRGHQQMEDANFSKLDNLTEEFKTYPAAEFKTLAAKFKTLAEFKTYLCKTWYNIPLLNIQNPCRPPADLAEDCNIYWCRRCRNPNPCRPPADLAEDCNIWYWCRWCRNPCKVRRL